jgi:two-component system, sensor histidine kinase YesM
VKSHTRLRRVQTRIVSLSLRSKIVLIFLVLGAFPFTVLGVISYRIYYMSFWNTTVQSVVQTSRQITVGLDALFHDTSKYLEIRYNDAVVSFLTRPGETYPVAKDILRLFQLYRNTYRFNENIQDIIIVGANGKCISERIGVYRLNIDAEHFTATYHDLLAHPHDIRIIHTSDDFQARQEGEKILSIGSAIIHPVTRTTLGIIILKMDINIVSRYFKDFQIAKAVSFSIYSSNRDRLFSSTDFPVKHADFHYLDTVFGRPRGSLVQEIDGQKMLTVFETSQETGLKTVGFAPVREIMKGANQIMMVVILCLALWVVIAVLLFLFISERLTQPIRSIMQRFKEAAAGNLDVRVEPRSGDEVAELGNSFNRMVAEIKNLMLRVILEHEDLKRTELKLLQAQINPHFLYNTLDTIVWMAEGGQKEKVVSLVKSLSNFFRVSLSKGREWVPISEELSHVRSYLEIQKLRYEDILDFTIEVEDSILGGWVPKIILQPIIENALYHGVKSRRHRGRISLCGARGAQGSIVFRVADNGVGMSAEKLADVRKNIREGSRDGHPDNGFGLANVNERLRLAFGEPYGVAITSLPDEGTSVILTMPEITSARD